MTVVMESSDDCGEITCVPATTALVEGLVRTCSSEALQRRFFLPAPTTPAAVLARYGTYLLAGPPEGAAVVARRSGRSIGLLNLVVTAPGTVEAGLLVADDWQRRRVATCLLEAELRSGRWAGWTIVATVQADNRPVLALLQRLRLGQLRVLDGGPSAWEFAIELAATRTRR